MQEIINEIQDLQLKKEELEKQIEALKSQVTELDSNINEKKDELIKVMDDSAISTIDTDTDLNAMIFSKENVAYKNEAEVISWLKQNCQSDLIRIKTTESLDKTAIKKAIKNNPDLAADLDQFIEKTTTRWVVVTTKENHERMLEHINSGK